MELGLARALARVGLSASTGLTRLTGGATMESWRFATGGEDLILRRAPSLAFIANRPMSHASEAAVIEAARAAGVTAPEVLTVLQESDGLGSGFIMRALPGTSNPKDILAMDGADTILREAARDLARIHSLSREDLPADAPVMDYRAAIADLRQQFEEAGGDRPIIALGLKWMEDNCPDECAPVLNHGDYRMGNILAKDGHLTGVLDWELAHFGDPHEDLAFGCMAVWRFARYDRPALGLGSLDDYFAAYEAESGRTVDRERFRYWLIHRTVWWALGCLKCAKTWREGSDRSLERVVISRRTSEQELDLLMLLEEEIWQELPRKPLDTSLIQRKFSTLSEARFGEIATAVLDWLATIKDDMQAHDRFQHAVACNALGIIARESEAYLVSPWNRSLSDALLKYGLHDDPEILDDLRLMALGKVMVDSPKYPALAVARKKWTGED
ncbi:phosphotransferase family protein [Altererythrobacter sp. BO-6]|nr:phosphotransferase family protein [Altererythrobacter sp. BO-6]